MIFYLNDKVRINLSTSGLHGKVGIVTNPLGAQAQVKVIDDNGKEREFFYWNDELILFERNSKEE